MWSYTNFVHSVCTAHKMPPKTYNFVLDLNLYRSTSIILCIRRKLATV